ncbi:MAG: FG-GAP-like repeat-containing protein [Planctomycetota bacterium]
MPPREIPTGTTIVALLLTTLWVGCKEQSRPDTRLENPKTSSSKGTPPPGQEAQATTASKRSSSLRALKLLEGRRFDEAWDECQKVLVNAPTDARALFVAAQVLYERKRLDQSLQMIDRIAVTDPEYGLSSHRDAVQWCLRARRLEESERLAQRLLEKVPRDIETLKSLAANLDLQGRRYEASKVMQQLVIAGQTDPTYLILAIDTAKPIRSDDEIQGRLDELPQEALLNSSLAFGALYEDLPEEAEGLFRKVLANASAPAACHAGLGSALIAQEKFEELPAWLAQSPRPAIDALPLFWRIMGLWYQHLDQHPHAIYCFTRSIELDPFDFLAWGPLSQSLTANQQLTEAAFAERQFQTMQLANRNVNYARDGFRKPEWMLQVADVLTDHDRKIESLAWKEWCEKVNSNDSVEIRTLQAERQQLTSSYQMTNPTTRLPWTSQQLVAPDLSLLALQRSSPSKENPKTNPTFSSPGNVSFQLQWRDVAAELGAVFQYDNGNDKKFFAMKIHQSIGAGSGCIDFDRDGWPDLFLQQGGGDPRVPNSNKPTVLFRNHQGQAMSDVAPKAFAVNIAYGQGVAVGDWDQDGFADIFLLNFGRNAVLHNQGDGTFEQVDIPSMHRNIENNPIWSVSGAIADLNGDHLPDLIEVNYSLGVDVITRQCLSKDRTPQVCRPTDFPPSKDYIYLSDGYGGFELANSQWNLELDDGRGLGLIVGNLDQQYGNDIYIANDMSANNLLISSHDPSLPGRFMLTDEAVRRGCAVDIHGRPQASMGIGCSDVDRNGTLDLFMTNFIEEYNALYLQSPTHFFQDASRRYRLIDPKKMSLGFGTQLVDLDLDGWQDAFIVNGHVDDCRSKGQPFEMRAQILLQRDGAFQEQVTDGFGTFFSKSFLSRSLGIWDFNRDGKIDWAITHLDQPLTILRNDSTSDGSWLMLECIGTESERDAIGTTIQVHCGEERWLQQRLAGNGFECSNEPWVFFGLGRQPIIDRLEVRWPSGRVSTFQNVPIDRRYRLVESQDDLVEDTVAIVSPH